MGSIKDDRGYNQGFQRTNSTTIRMKRRAHFFIEEMGQLGPEHSVLEIGCGNGDIAYWMAESVKAKVLGTDLCEPFIAEASKKYQLPNLKYMVLDFNKPQALQGQKFDYIVGNGILHHLYYGLDQALDALGCLLKENGKIIFMEPNIYNPYCTMIFKVRPLRKLAHLEPDEMAFSKNFIRRKLQKHQYKNIKVNYRDFLLPGIPDIMVKPSIAAGNVLEKTPALCMMAQSIFITAERN